MAYVHTDQTATRSPARPGPVKPQAPITAHTRRLANLFGQRFVQEDGTVLLLMTWQACRNAHQMLGLNWEHLHRELYGCFLVVQPSGSVIHTGRRSGGATLERWTDQLGR